VEDVRRHLQDLREGAFEGAESREDRIELFRRAVELLDPIVRAILAETNAAFLDGTGDVDLRPVSVEASGDAVAAWELSWPEQRRAANVRRGGAVPPIQVVAWFAAGFTHPHLRGSQAGTWPLQVTDERDALRQEPIVRAIVEAELHERIFEGTWRIVPGDPSEDARPGG
jgi:hypothetical protein